MRIGVAGFLHESNSFLPVPTPYESFASTSLTRGEAMRARWVNASHELGGMLSTLGAEAVPLYATFAVPSGAIERSAFERIASELVEAVREAGPLDGLLLALHGATVAEGYPDADGEILSRMPDLPIVATFDLHANISPRMVSRTKALIGYRSNPHLDQKERGIEAAELMREILRGQAVPVQACEHLPMLIANSRQHTAGEPSAGLYRDLDEVLKWPGILTASVAMGFPHSDVEEVGAAFLATANGDTELAERAAKWMADRAWQRREEFVSSLPDAAEAVRLAGASQKLPVVLLDTGDNVGGGSAADSTILLHELRAQGIDNGLIVLHAPDAVVKCVVRQEVTLTVGTPPIEIRGRVRTISDGLFVETAVRHGGWTHNDQGITAVVETEDRHTIVLTSRRMAPFSLEQLLSLGIHPERKRVLIVKGVVAPRAAYEPIAGEFILAGTPGATADDPRLLPYRFRRHPLYPMEDSNRSAARADLPSGSNSGR
jgi:microcystin degradation protein MlrC